jgi:ketosteroid isomerase-like protein
MRGFTTREQEDLWRFVRGINDAWVKGRADELPAFFHEDAVITSADGKTLTRGAAATVASYVEFAERGTVHEFKEQTPEIDVFGNTAVVRYGFQIRWEAGGKTSNERGRDVLVLSRDDESRWRVAWRQVSSAPVTDKD